MNAILDAGLSIPRDIAVVGAGNVHYSDVLTVPLTTIDQETRQIGRRSAELLLEQIASKNTMRPKKIWIAPKLVVRKSSQRLQSSRRPKDLEIKVGCYAECAIAARSFTSIFRCALLNG